MCKHDSGILEVVCGSMFCGKTEEMIRRLRRAKIAHQKIQVFKPIIDTRCNPEKITSHAGMDFEATPVKEAKEILSLVEKDTTVVGVDEAQFFDDGIINVVDTLADQGKRVIVNGLDTNFRGDPFGPMPTIMARADKLDKLQAICMVCGQPASRTQRLVDGHPAKYDDPLVIVGAAEMYEARCRHCHKVPRE